MGLFDSIQNIIGSLTGSAGDIVGGLAENEIIQDRATGLTDGVSDAATSLSEQGQTTVDEITQNLGL